jgi:hypothetical protein
MPISCSACLNISFVTRKGVGEGEGDGNGVAEGDGNGVGVCAMTSRALICGATTAAAPSAGMSFTNVRRVTAVDELLEHLSDLVFAFDGFMVDKQSAVNLAVSNPLAVSIQHSAVCVTEIGLTASIGWLTADC